MTVKIDTQMIGDDPTRILTIREEGFDSLATPDAEGVVHSEYRCLDGTCEGIGLAISYESNMPAKDGHYLPQNLTVDETIKLRDFLTERIRIMRKQEKVESGIIPGNYDNSDYYPKRGER